VRIFIAALALIAAPLAAAAQSTATVSTNAPIYITKTPAANLAPLRVAAVGTVLRVVGQEGDWLQVQFEDPQWGRRTGWVQKRHVSVSDPALKPMDLSIRETPAKETAVQQDGHARSDDIQDPTSVRPRQPGSTPVDSVVGHPQIREGFWFNAGLGFGSLGCENCIGRENGLSGGLSLGGRISDKVLLGVGTAGWAKELEDGELISVGTLDARMRFYPARRSGFFLTGGLGIGSVTVEGESEFGVGLILGVGWDIRVARNVSLTPFYSGFAMSSSTEDANVGQIGIGVTIH
jgi:uncharacterized protein YraI